ncbi:MAG: hypothetical protein ABFD66_12255 [Smithella sp.]
MNNGIEQLSVVVQTNSATSEQTAAAEEELPSRAELLKNMVVQFRLREYAAQRNWPVPVEEAKKKAAPTKIKLTDNCFGKY